MSTKRKHHSICLPAILKREKKILQNHSRQKVKRKEATYIVYLEKRKRTETRDADQLQI